MTLLFVASFVLSHCGTTGQAEITYPLYARGQTSSTFAVSDYQVTLDVAQLGIGPIYFCTTAAASSDLCPSALAEFNNSTFVDLLNPDPQNLGTVRGLTGTIHSATYDFGITWLATAYSPSVSPQAPNGHSAHFEGHATRNNVTTRFILDVDITPQTQGTRAIAGSRVNAPTLDNAHVRLDMRFNPQAWWTLAAFDEVASLAGDPVTIPATSRTSNAIIVGITASAPPVFEWTTVP